MTDDHLLLFDTLHLDTANECVWCDEQAIQLTPKAFALLRYLAEHAGQLVTKDELLNAVWPEVVVSENVLTTHVNIIRQALGDKAKAPRYIETVHRRGYRFIAPLSTTSHLSLESRVPRLASKDQSPRCDTEPTLDPRRPTLDVPLVGREPELTQLHEHLAKAVAGERQLVFVTGEAGIGKTTVVEAFLKSLESRVQRLAWEDHKRPISGFQTLDSRPQTLDADVWLGQGQCIEQFGAGEAYLPLLSAFGQLGRGSDHKQVLSLLHQYAPTWLLQMPALVTPPDFEVLQRRTAGATRERMLREMAEALEVLTAVTPLVLVLEDLHWSDPSTLELLSFLARRRQPARLLVIGTYRPVEVLANGHPLRAVTQELQLHRHCEDLPLPLLNEEDIVQYLADRLSAEAASQLPLQPLAQAIYRRTEGNPLFMVNVVDDLLVRGVVDRPEIELSTPMTVRQMVERQFDHLSPAERHVLEAASVTGVEFSATAVAAGLETTSAEVETHCADLARREQFLQRSVSNAWPDGTVAACYRFHHALYQEVVYEQVTVSRRSDLHQRIGERLEVAYRERTSEVAAELAVHFEQGRDCRRAIQYLEQAGKNAVQRRAHIEAISHFTRGLELLKTLPDTPERTQQELSLQIALGAPLMATKGFGAPEVEPPYARARELCRWVGETPQLVPVLWGLFTFYGMKGDSQAATELAEQLMRLAQNLQDSAALLIAHRVWGVHLFFSGELTQARIHLEQVIALYDRQQHHTLAFLYGGYDPGVHCLGYMAGTLWHLGYPDQALKKVNEALTLAQDLSHPSSLIYALDWAAVVHRYLREGPEAQRRWAETQITLSTEQGLPHFVAEGTIWRGWALVEQGQAEEGIAQIRRGIAIFQTTGAAQRPEFPALLAEAYGRAGQAEKGLSILAEPLAVLSKHGERYFYAAELYRLKGALTLQKQSQVTSRRSKVSNTQHLTPSTQAEAEAEACFLKAIEIAQQQQAKSLELRATTSLARLWQQQGKLHEAHNMLSTIYNWFTEGFDTKDLQEAKALIEELSHEELSRNNSMSK